MNEFPSVPPHIIGEKIEEQTVIAGDDITLPVNFEGFPPPSITWYLNEEKLSTSDRITFNGRDDLAELKISKPQVSDAGNYKLILSNKVGETQTCCHVKVIGNDPLR